MLYECGCMSWFHWKQPFLASFEINVNNNRLDISDCYGCLQQSQSIMNSKGNKVELNWAPGNFKVIDLWSIFLFLTRPVQSTNWDFSSMGIYKTMMQQLLWENHFALIVVYFQMKNFHKKVPYKKTPTTWIWCWPAQTGLNFSKRRRLWHILADCFYCVSINCGVVAYCSVSYCYFHMARNGLLQ